MNHIWLTLMNVFNCIIESNGDNNYKLPHMHKQRLENQGALPTTIKVTEAALPYLGAQD